MVTLGRIGLGAVTLGVVPSERRAIDRQDWPRLAVLGLLWIAIPETLLPVAQQWINSAITGMLIGAVPSITAIIAAVMLRRRPGIAQQLGITIGLVGIVLISLPSVSDGNTALIGVGAVLVAALLYALSANLTPLQQKYGSLPVMRRVLAIGVVFTVPYALVGADQSARTAPAVGAVIVLGIVATGVAFVAYGALIGHAGATRASGVLCVLPVVALVLGISLRGDEVKPLAYLGCICIVIATVFVSRQGR